MIKELEKNIRTGFIVLFLSCTVCAGFCQPSVVSDKDEGKAIVEELLNRLPEENNEILGLLKIRPADQDVVEIPIKMTTQVNADGWEDVYETQPVVGREKQVLIVKHKRHQPNSYLFGNEKVSPLGPEKIYQTFAGSDFSCADLGLEFLHWPSQKLIKKEMRKGRSCRVVQSTNPNPSLGAYARVLAWIDFETGGIIRAEGYDQKNKLLKEFSIRKVDRDEGRLKEIEIRNDQTDSRTRLEFNLKVKDP